MVRVPGSGAYVGGGDPRWGAGTHLSGAGWGGQWGKGAGSRPRGTGAWQTLHLPPCPCALSPGPGLPAGGGEAHFSLRAQGSVPGTFLLAGAAVMGRS